MALTSKISGSQTAIISETITGATQANPVVLTLTGTALVNGDTILVSGVVGMTEINDRRFTVANKATNSVELEGEDGTGHTAYTSGGTVTEVEHTLSTITDAGTYVLTFDSANLVNDETVTLRVKSNRVAGRKIGPITCS